MIVYVVSFNECILGVYRTEQLAERLGMAKSVERFGYAGVIEPFSLDDEPIPDDEPTEDEPES